MIIMEEINIKYEEMKKRYRDGLENTCTDKNDVETDVVFDSNYEIIKKKIQTIYANDYFMSYLTLFFTLFFYMCGIINIYLKQCIFFIYLMCYSLYVLHMNQKENKLRLEYENVIKLWLMFGVMCMINIFVHKINYYYLSLINDVWVFFEIYCLFEKSSILINLSNFIMDVYKRNTFGIDVIFIKIMGIIKAYHYYLAYLFNKKFN